MENAFVIWLFLLNAKHSAIQGKEIVILRYNDIKMSYNDIWGFHQKTLYIAITIFLRQNVTEHEGFIINVRSGLHSVYIVLHT